MTFQIPINGKLFNSLLGTGQSYHDATAGKKPEDHRMGPPHIHQFTAMVEALCAMQGAPAAPVATLRQWWATHATKGIAEICFEVRSCRVTKPWDKEKRRVEFAILDKDASKAILELLVFAGGKAQMGKAAAGSLENDLQRWLDEHRARA